MLISVYVPTKNRARLLAEAIASVRAQTVTNWELIVVDDGSTDETPALLQRLAAEEPRLRYLRHERSQGGPAARNAAILASRGDFVTGLDDDDSFTPERLQRFAEAWFDHLRAGRKPAGLYSQLNVMVDGRQVDRTAKPATARFDEMFRENVVGNQIFAPRQHYIDAGLFRPDLPAWQDIEFFMRMLKQHGVAYLVDAATYNWDNSPRSDRVSLKAERNLRYAFDAVKASHGGRHARHQQQLYLQLFGKFYGIRPTWDDWRSFIGLGIWPRGIVKLLRTQFAR